MTDDTLVGPGAVRLQEADRTVDGRTCTPATTDGLFAISDLVSGNVALRRVLTDPAYAPERRSALLRQLLEGKVDGDAVAIAAEIAGLRWSNGRALSDALEREAVRSELLASLSAGALDQVEDELFRFSRTVAGTRELRAALEDRAAPLEARENLVRNVFGTQAHGATSRLARRALLGKQRTYVLTLEHYLQLAAQVRQRMVARVTVAQPMTDEQQRRLQAALSQQQNRNVDLQVIVDPAVLGGVKVELGDDVIDGTVQRRIDDVTRQLS